MWKEEAFEMGTMGADELVKEEEDRNLNSV